MLMEALSAIADELSYLQDRVAAESTLETATQRLSLVRHARLVDYEPTPADRGDDRSCSSTSPAAPRRSPAASAAARSAPTASAFGSRSAARSRIPRPGALTAPVYTVSSPWNAWASPGVANLQPYWWDDSRQCLPAGSTRHLDHRARPRVQANAGQQLLLDTAGPTTPIPPVRELVVDRAPSPRRPIPSSRVPLTRVDLAAPTPAGPRSRRARTSPGTSSRPSRARATARRSRSPSRRRLRRRSRRSGRSSSAPRPNWTPRRSAARLPLLARGGAALVAAGRLHRSRHERDASSPRPSSRSQSPTDLGTARPWRWQRWLLDAGPADPVFTLTPERYSAGRARARPRPGSTTTARARRSASATGSSACRRRRARSVHGHLPRGRRLGRQRPGRHDRARRSRRAADREGRLGHQSVSPRPAAPTRRPSQQIRDRAPQAFQAKPLRVVRPSDYVAAAQSLPWVQQAGTSLPLDGELADRVHDGRPARSAKT